MPQVWKVKKAFQSTNRETQEPDVVKTQGGDMHKFMAQVEGQPVDGWLQILKKPGNELKPGDELYGDIVENNWGKPQFNRAQRPQEDRAPAQSSNQASAPQGNSSVTLEMVYNEVKYVRGLLENRGNFPANGQPAAQAGNNSAPADDGDQAVDLSQLDY